MAITSRAPNGGLSTTDIDAIRSSLADGRKPKVMFTQSAGQIAGETGQVVQLTDPGQSDEWLVVRFGRDELPFSPGDLSIPPRAKRTTAAKSTSSAAKSTPKPAAAAPPKAAAAAPPKAAAAPPPVPPPRAPEATEQPVADQPRKPAKRAAKSARTAKPKPPASMTVTLAYDAGEWTVAAHQGSKTLAKPYLIRPADALKMVAMLDVPGVHDAVEQIVTAELTEAQRRADTLRNELAEVEARLAELRDVNP
jgi:hypothetical protein